MSKFVRIDKGEDPKKAVMLNLDLVATVELLHQARVRPHEAPRSSITLHSADQLRLASLDFDSVDQANRWALQHLGIEL